MKNVNIVKKLSLIISPLLLVACANIPTEDTSQKTNNEQQQTEAKPEKYKVSKTNETSSASSAVVSLLQRAQQQQENGNVVGAVSSLERAIRISPRYPESYYRLAEIYYKQGKNNQARSLAEKALSLGASGELQTKSQSLINKINN